jgi:hypothetical protein
LDWSNQQDETAPALFLKKYLKSFNPEIIGLKGLSNNRVSKAFASLKLLHNENLVTVADINREINQSSYTSFEAQEFWDIELDSIYKIDVIPAEIPENFDVIARRLDGHGVPLIESYQHVDAASLKPIAYYASQPLNVAIMPRVIEQLRKQLSAQLPDYMLPQRYLLLSRLPMTPSGKLDRRALPLPNNSRPVLEQEYVPPKTDTEISLAGLWSEVLELDQVGVNDNFFDLGGNSILSVSVGMRIRLLLEVDVAVVTLFQYPTIRTLSRYIDNDNQGKNINELVRSRAEKQKMAFAKSVRKYRD